MIWVFSVNHTDNLFASLNIFLFIFASVFLWRLWHTVTCLEASIAPAKNINRLIAIERIQSSGKNGHAFRARSDRIYNRTGEQSDRIYNRAEKQSVHYYRESKTKLPFLAALRSGHDIRYRYSIFARFIEYCRLKIATLVFYVNRLLRSWRLSVLRVSPRIH